MKTTQIIYSKNLNKNKHEVLLEQAKLLGNLRSEIWRVFGSINGVGVNHRKIRTEWVKEKSFSPLSAKAWKETLRDTLSDIRLYEDACKLKVRKKINLRFSNKEDRKKYFGLLKYNKWTKDPLLYRWMRKVKKHGKNHVFDQIILEDGVYKQFIGNNGNTWLKISSLVKGKMISIPLGSNVELKGCLRLILKDRVIEVHMFSNKGKPKPCGDKIIGVDKGYSEVLVDSEGDFHGVGFNKVLTNISKIRNKKNKARNRLFQIAKKSKSKKRARIYKNNLGSKKRIKRNKKTKQLIRNYCFTAVHSVIDKAKELIVEDLSFSFSENSKKGKNFNRLMNQWTKGLIEEALNTVVKDRGSVLHYVNAAYTSQMDSTTCCLEGRRVGDRFHHANGDVSHADVNAACNIKHRYLFDKEISLYLSYQKVKKILLSRLRASEELACFRQATVPSGL